MGQTLHLQEDQRTKKNCKGLDSDFYRTHQSIENYLDLVSIEIEIAW
jgi:hypothetical protein